MPARRGRTTGGEPPPSPSCSLDGLTAADRAGLEALSDEADGLQVAFATAAAAAASRSMRTRYCLRPGSNDRNGRKHHLGLFATAEEAALAVVRFLGPKGIAAIVRGRPRRSRRRAGDDGGGRSLRRRRRASSCCAPRRTSGFKYVSSSSSSSSTLRREREE